MTARWGVGVWVSALGLACAAGDPCQEGRGICLEVSGAAQIRTAFVADSVALADLDGDGRLDLVAAGNDVGTLTVVWGGSDMFEGTATTWSVAPTIAGAAVGDFDGDGRLDLATTIPADNAVAVLSGRAGRQLTQPVHIPVGVGPHALVPAELDGAAPLELVVADAEGTIHVIRETVVTASLAVGAGAHALATGDFDGDGALDVVIAVVEAGVLQLAQGDGAGGLSPGPRFAAGVAPYSVIAADLDGDGALDLAAADAVDDAVDVLFGDGGGGVREQARWPTDPEPRVLRVIAPAAGPPVLAVLSAGTGLVQEIDPRTGTTTAGTSTSSPTALAGGDVDGDGDEDLLYVSWNGEVGRFSPGLGLRLEPRWPLPAAGLTFPVTLDDDRDGVVVDLVPQPPGEVSATTRAIAVAVGPDLLIEAMASGLEEPLTGALAADLTGDGRRELVVWNRREVAVHERRPDGSFAPPFALDWSYPFVRSVVAGDCDGDGRVELIAANGSILAAHVPVADGAEPPVEDVDLGVSISGLTVRDVDGDGRSDLVASQDTGMVVFADMRLDRPPRTIALEYVESIRTLELVDLDEDGSDDAFLCHEGGFARVRDVFGVTPGAFENLDNNGCHEIAVTDLDADGRDEIVTFGGAGVGEVFTPWIVAGDGLTRLGSTSLNTAELPQVARLEDAGVLDLVVTGPDGRAVAMDMSLGPAMESATINRFAASLTVDLGDVDGDGVMDVIGTGQAVAVARGDGRGFGPLQRISLARILPSAYTVVSAVVADLDGDGHDEVAVVASRSDRKGYMIASVDALAETAATISDGLPRSRHLLVADADGDRRLDLLALSDGPSTLDVAFLRGHGDGRFDPPESSQIDGASVDHGHRTFDLDRDGRLDLIGGAGGIRVHRGHGDGSFGAGEVWSAVLTNDAAIGDLDRDGKLDVVATLAPNGQVRDDLVLLLGKGAADLQSPRVLLGHARAVAVADLDGDGELEILASGRDSDTAPGSSALHVGTGVGGIFHFARQLVAAPPSRIRVVDGDGDGTLDVALLGTTVVTLVWQMP